MRKIYIFFIPLIVLLFITFSLPAGAADSKFNQGLEKTGLSAGYPVAAAANPGNFLARMFGSVLTPMFMGVNAMLILMYGGYTLLMARGNEEQVAKAKTIIANTVIASIVAFSAYAIFKLIMPLWEFVTQ